LDAAYAEDLGAIRKNATATSNDFPETSSPCESWYVAVLANSRPAITKNADLYAAWIAQTRIAIAEVDWKVTNQRKQTITIVEVATTRFASCSGLDRKTRESRQIVEILRNKKLIS
jgi:hypothetical protein